MSKYIVQPTGNERFFGEDEVIVSKTDLKGRVTYANDVFLRIAGFDENEVLGKPHSFIRHPAMPRCIFKFLWDTLEKKDEVFAYVINMARNGDHYWVFAHVTPTLDKNDNIIGYHSNRRVPRRDAIASIEGIYKDLLAAEDSLPNAKESLQKSHEALIETVTASGMAYEELVFTL